jgi:RHS repeat-associated protein
MVAAPPMTKTKPALERAHRRARVGLETRVGVFDLAGAAHVGARARRSREVHSGKSCEVRQHAAGISVFENWNRYYDPFTGRYLQPEPLLTAPIAPAWQALSGAALPTYAYAVNNPVGKFDTDGREGDTWTTYCKRHPEDPACSGQTDTPPDPTKGGGGTKPDVPPIPGGGDKGNDDKNCPKGGDDDDDNEVICQRDYEACVQQGGDSLPGNHYNETRCGSCKNVCLQQGWWPSTIPSPGGGRWNCPG